MHPAAGDVFYMRMLLHHDHCRGKTSFTDLRTVNGICHESFQEVCRILGLLQDDKEWDQVLTDGSFTKMCPALRELFITIILFCMPANPQELFEKHHMEWIDDIQKKAATAGQVWNDQQLRILVLIDIQQRLMSWGRNLSMLRLPEPTAEEKLSVSITVNIHTALIREELEFDVEDLEKLVNERSNMFTESQKIVFDTVMKSVINQEPLALFIDARGGTGKTFVLNTILAAVRLIQREKGGSVALATGTTGIAANLLQLGRTFHSRFKAPLTPNKDSICSIDAQSSLAKLIRISRIIIIDEASMLHRYYLEALNRTLQDLMSNVEIFGGKLLVLSGDFRQCLPVIPHAERVQIVDATLNKSPLWKHFNVLKLKENMRLMSYTDPILVGFDEWALSIGEGSAPTVQDTDLIEIPEEMCLEINSNSTDNPKAELESMKQLANHVYPGIENNYFKPDWMEGRAILAPTNAKVDAINDLITDSFPGKPIVFTSSDEVVNPDDLQRYNTEYLNTLTPSGLPNHRLFLKAGMPLMLMRNLNPKMGLCNGTRLIFNIIVNNFLLECSISGGQFKNRRVLIPRILFKPKERQFPFEWTRRQFPVKVCFAMTINKSQGQTLQHIGIWLSDSCFGHGQLYVADSRVGSPLQIKFAIKKIDSYPANFTSNVVFKEVLGT